MLINNRVAGATVLVVFVAAAWLGMVALRAHVSDPEDARSRTTAMGGDDWHASPLPPQKVDFVAQESPAPAAADFLDQAKHYQVNFVEALADIRRQCLPEWNRQQCNEMTRNFLRDQIRTNALAELLRVYDQYLQYEDYIALNNPLQGLDLEGTYQTLRQLRAQFIDEDARRWLFGAEDARMAYEFALQDFIAHDASRLSLPQRLERLEHLRREQLGAFYELFLSHEDPADYYQAQLQLAELPGGDTEQKQQLVEQIRAKINSRQY